MHDGSEQQHVSSSSGLRLLTKGTGFAVQLCKPQAQHVDTCTQPQFAYNQSHVLQCVQCEDGNIHVAYMRAHGSLDHILMTNIQVTLKRRMPLLAEPRETLQPLLQYHNMIQYLLHQWATSHLGKFTSAQQVQQLSEVCRVWQKG